MCLNLGEVAVGILTGKTVLVTGIARADSIAFAVADRAMREGADVALTVYPRDLGSASDVIRTLPVKPAFVLPIDVTSEADLATLEAELRTGLGHVDAALHGVAFAPAAALDAVLDVPAAAVEIAFRTSVHSYAALAGVLKRLAPTSGASLVGLDFESGRAWPVYNWMGPCKAALRSLNQYLARDLGPDHIRANLVAAGPLLTRAAAGIPDFDRLLRIWASTSPLRWDPCDPAPVADVVCVLFSDMARAITGEVVHVDGGAHAMAGQRSDPALDD